jgi:hypothetical protein
MQPPDDDAAPRVVDFDNLPEDQAAEVAMSLARNRANVQTSNWVVERS